MNKFEKPRSDKTNFEVSREARFQAIDLEVACAYCDEHPDFDRSFIDSLQKYFDQKNFLTDAQYQALTRVMEAWQMEPWYIREIGPVPRA